MQSFAGHSGDRRFWQLILPAPLGGGSLTGAATSSPLGLALEGVSSTRPIGSNWSEAVPSE